MADLTNEHRRILNAVAEGRFNLNGHGRYIIDGEARPERKAREQVMNRRFVVWNYQRDAPVAFTLTDKGRQALAGEQDKAGTADAS
jgi:hypothetical protein